MPAADLLGVAGSRGGQRCRMRFAFVWVISSTLLAAAATPAGAEPLMLSCHGAQKSKMVAELLFGRDIGNRVGVSQSAWTRFVAREMTPRFPDGLTITDAIGQWRDRDSGTIVREPSKEVEIVLPGNDDDETRLDAIVTAYKRQFRQQSVGVIIRPACVSF
jgi:hypothetical protein